MDEERNFTIEPEDEPPAQSEYTQPDYIPEWTQPTQPEEPEEPKKKRRTWLKIAGTCGLLGAAITLHAIYNLLIAYGGAAQYVAYALPVLLVAAGKLSAFRLSRRK